MLIFAQHAKAYEEGRTPESSPSFIAGFNTWRALDRQVDRGQHGYAIPMRSNRREARDAESTVRVLRRGDIVSATETETKTAVLRGFTVETVFDASQTAGELLPSGLGPASSKVTHLLVWVWRSWT